MSNYMSAHQRSYIRYIRANPGCSIADVNRACKTTARAGHRWVYDGVKRLRRRGFLRAETRGARTLLWVATVCPTAPKEACSPGCPGWAVFNVGEPREGIQACDECRRFPSDAAARAHVRKCPACAQHNIDERAVDR